TGPLAAPGALVPHGLDVALVLGIGACSLVAQLLFTDAMGHVTAVSAAVVSPLTPLCAFGLGALALGEPLTARILAGSVVALSGVCYGSWPQPLAPLEASAG
ncbi:MAG: EamA family transporter, partial [Deltaproteobacteria bacterium]